MSGRWPKLVRPELCRTPVTVTLTDGETADGAPDGVLVLSLMCRLDDDPQESISPGFRGRRPAEHQRRAGGAVAAGHGPV